jgi:hypothetical protein
LERWASTDLQEVLTALREAAPLIACGRSHRDPRTEDRIQLARIEIGAAPTEEGCGRLLLLWDGYRCVECGRWFHRGCIQQHFADHRGKAGSDLDRAETRETRDLTPAAKREI